MLLEDVARQVPSTPICVFATHPFAAAHYVRVLTATGEFRLVTRTEKFVVGVFDGELSNLDAEVSLVMSKAPTTRSILILSDGEEAQHMRWLSRGIWGIVAHSRIEAELARAVSEVSLGRLWFPGELVMRYLGLSPSSIIFSSHLRPRLTEREIEVLDYLQRGMSNKEVGNLLNITERTVKFHVSNIFQKLHLHSRRQL